MKKYLYLVVACIALTSCEFANTAKENEQLTQSNDSLVEALQRKNAELESMLNIVSEIQAGFDKINEAEGRIHIDEDTELESSDIDKMNENMQYITQTMENNRKKIAELESKLKSSGAEVAGLRKLVKSLNSELALKVQEITHLKAEIVRRDYKITELDDSLKAMTDSVKDLEAVKAAQEETIAAQDAALGRAWYVYGTARELKEQNILKNGKVLEENDFNMDYFTPIDTRRDVVFPLYAKHADLLTTHPAGSWHTEQDDDGQLTLVINDPELFWSISRYMVIKVK